MATLQDFKEDIPLLVEAGLVAIKQGDEESAKKLFNAVGILDPKNLAKKMGFGLIALHKMDLGTAQKNFNEVLQEEKTNWRAQAFLAFSYILSAVQEGTNEEKIESLRKTAEISQEILEKCDVESTRQLAQSLLDWENELMSKVGEKGPVA